MCNIDFLLALILQVQEISCILNVILKMLMSQSQMSVFVSDFIVCICMLIVVTILDFVVFYISSVCCFIRRSLRSFYHLLSVWGEGEGEKPPPLRRVKPQFMLDIERFFDPYQYQHEIVTTTMNDNIEDGVEQSLSGTTSSNNNLELTSLRNTQERGPPLDNRDHACGCAPLYMIKSIVLSLRGSRKRRKYGQMCWQSAVYVWRI